jgi:hypothetical protein
MSKLFFKNGQSRLPHHSRTTERVPPLAYTPKLFPLRLPVIMFFFLKCGTVPLDKLGEKGFICKKE